MIMLERELTPEEQAEIDADWERATAPRRDGEMPTEDTEQKRKAEVDELLSRLGMTREQVEGSPGPDELPAPEEKHWTDALKEEENAAADVLEDVDPDLLPGDCDLNGAKVPQYPVALISKLVNADKKITKEQVYSVLANFRMSVSLGDIVAQSRSIVVTDKSQKDLMKKARELRLALKRERIRIDSVGAAVKEPHLRRIQLIDGARKMLRDLLETEECYLKEQEDFARNEAIREKNELREKRLAELNDFEAVIPESLDVADLTDAAYAEFLRSSQAAFHYRQEQIRLAEEERIRREQAAQIENARLEKEKARIAELCRLGFRFDGTQLTLSGLTVQVSEFSHAGDDEFIALLERIRPQLTEIKAKQEREAERQRIEHLRQQRIFALTSRGMTLAQDGGAYVHTAAASAGRTISVPVALLDADGSAWQEAFNQVAELIHQFQEAEKAERERLQQIAAEQERQRKAAESEAERKRLAPDREKLLDLRAALAGIEIPQVDARFGPVIGKVKASLLTAIQAIDTATKEDA
jgi:hypothetical protein